MTNIAERLRALKTEGMLPVIAEAADELERLTALAQSNDDITWELTGENVRLAALLKAASYHVEDAGDVSLLTDIRRALENKP